MSNVSHAANWISERRADNVALAPRISEDWLSLIIGLLIFVLALAGLANVNLLGWVVTTSVWTNLGQALKTVSNSYGSLDRKSTRLNSSHIPLSRMPSSA